MKAIEAMSPEERKRSEELNDAIGDALHSYMADSDRSTWSMENRLGVSDIGHCREFARRTIINEPWSDEQEDYSAAFMGTAIGDLAEKAMLKRYPDQPIEVQIEVTVVLDIGGFNINLMGHPDLVIKHTVVDFKTKDGLGVVRRTGPEDKQWFQVFLYTKAMVDSGRIPFDEAWMVLSFIDRSGREPKPVTFARKFSEYQHILQDISMWLEDVIYAVQQGEEASRDMPRPWCWSSCQRVTACRGQDTDAEGLIDHPVFVEALGLYNDAKERKKVAENDVKSAQGTLAKVSGIIDGFTVRWIEISPTDTRQGYKRLDVRPVGGRKRETK